MRFCRIQSIRDSFGPCRKASCRTPSPTAKVSGAKVFGSLVASDIKAQLGLRSGLGLLGPDF